MFFSTWIIYAAVAMAAIICPGPAVFLAISNSVTFGWRRVAFSSLGNVLGLLVVSSLAMAGLGALMKTSATVFTAIKLLGAGYLIYMGLRQWRSRGSLFTQDHGHAGGDDRSDRQLFVQGLLIALTNPKAILFFTALFPQFLRSDLSLAPQFLILTTTFMGFSFLILMLYGLVANAARGWFAEESRAMWFNRVTGSLFLALGLGMLRLSRARLLT
jgi:threonine/homoserine/homoserine lactone efflux protein